MEKSSARRSGPFKGPGGKLGGSGGAPWRCAASLVSSVQSRKTHPAESVHSVSLMGKNTWGTGEKSGEKDP